MFPILLLLLFLLFFRLQNEAFKWVTVSGFPGSMVTLILTELEQVLLGWDTDHGVWLWAALPEQGQADPHQGSGEIIKNGQAGLSSQFLLASAGSPPDLRTGPTPGRELLQ